MAKRIDANQKQIVMNLRQLGFSVQILSSLGKGCPDLLIGRQKKNWLIELKDGAKFASQQKLTPDEIRWHCTWNGQAAICNSLDQILKITG